MPRAIYNIENDWGEARRMRAMDLRRAGWKQCDIAKALGVTPSAISHWVKRARLLGLDSLRHHQFGRLSRLSDDNREALRAMLSRGPAYNGFPETCWTRVRVKELLWREFGVSFHLSHVGRVMHSCGLVLRRGRRAAIHRVQSREVSNGNQLRLAAPCSFQFVEDQPRPIAARV